MAFSQSCKELNSLCVAAEPNKTEFVWTDVTGQNCEQVSGRFYLQLFLGLRLQFFVFSSVLSKYTHYQSPPSPHGRDVTTQFPLLISFHGERTANSVNDILMFQLHHGILYLKHGDSFKATYYKKVPRLGINLWLQVQIFLYHVNPSQGRTFDQSAVLETTTRDFVQASQGIALASRCLVYIRPSAYELETKVQRLDGSSLAMTTTTQVNKVKPLVKSAVGPHDTLLLHGISRKSLCIQGVSKSSTSSQQDQDTQDCIVMPIWKDASYFDDASPKSVADAQVQDQNGSHDDYSLQNNSTTDQQVNTASPEVNTGSRLVSSAVSEVNTATPEDLMGLIPTVRNFVIDSSY
ncbi:hypothetical protein Tco_0703189 [Tanacetum coccineum]|uniref:Uncharacterized protein n=1 Tax=Tanacetum coccineum TaxID=301880 RepID=A0ABQ4XY60_9ASTR